MTKFKVNKLLPLDLDNVHEYDIEYMFKKTKKKKVVKKTKAQKALEEARELVKQVPALR